jgi:hypothetical protein
MLKTFQVKLDIEEMLHNPSSALFTVSSNDFESIELQFEISQDGAAFDLTGTTVELAIKKPSGLVIYQTVEITDAPEGKAAVKLTNQSYIEYGFHTAELYIRNETQLAITSPFYYMSREAIMNEDAIESTNDWSALQEALFNMDKKPILVDGVPAAMPEYIGQMAFDTTGKRAFIANDVSETGWQLLAAGEGGGGGLVYWADVLNKPTEFAPAAHIHEIADVTGLQAALDAAGTGEPADWGEITNKPATFPPDIHTHDFADITGKPAAYPAEAHNHGWGEITNKPATFPPENHMHNIAAITGLQAELDSKADSGEIFSGNWADITNKPATFPAEAHNHTAADISDFGTAVVSNIPDEFLTQTEADDRYAIKGTEGGTVAAAWGDIAGTLANQADLQAALDAKADDADLAGKADAAHTHSFAEITDKPAAYPAEAHNHGWGEITGKPLTFPPDIHTHDFADITGKPATYPAEAHNHAIADVTGLQAALDGKADDADLAGKADAAHKHSFAEITDKPATYPAEAHTHSFAEITDKPAAYPAETHTHAIADVTGLQTALDGKADDADLAGKADAAHTHSFAEITGKPATYPAEAHTHTTADITDFATGVAGAIPAEYLTATEGDAKYQPIGTTTEPAAHTHLWADITDKPTSFVPNLMTPATRGGAKAGNGLMMAGTNNEWLTLRLGTGLAINGTTSALQIENGLAFWKGTQAQYDAIATKDPNRIYFITG